MKNSILVTGAAGFIGSHLCEALLKIGYTVIGIDNFDSFYDRKIKEQNLNCSLQHPDFTFIEGDAGDKNLLISISAKIDIVVHLAAKAGVLPSLNNPQAYIKTNIALTNNLLEWMKEKDLKKLVFASSSSVYGNNSKIPFEEADGVNEPISPYAFSKRSCELMNYTYHSLYGFDIINLRFFTVYGERQRPDLAIHKFVHNILEGKPIKIYGDGKTARDYTYYADTVDGVLSAINYIETNSGVWDTFNLGNHNPVYLIDLINTISSVCKVDPILVFEDMKPGDVNITYASIEKAAKVLGYNPRVEIKTGIENFVKWYKEQLVIVN
ncbi:MAG: NAD-dependent epimerase/dehydratase family protein [Aquaticitalea sp.]